LRDVIREGGRIRIIRGWVMKRTFMLDTE